VMGASRGIGRATALRFAEQGRRSWWPPAVSPVCARWSPRSRTAVVRPWLSSPTPLLPGADQWVLLDIDDTVRQTYGYATQGASRAYTGASRD
jgi:hypothetical protein